MPAKKKMKLRRIEFLNEVYRRVIEKYGFKSWPKIRGKALIKRHCRKRVYKVDIVQKTGCSINPNSVSRVYVCSRCFSFC